MRTESAQIVQLSVVIPAFNAAPYIAESLNSVLEQKDAPAFEVIVVDDGSQDQTAEIVARDFPSVQLIRKSNGGPGSARNRGVYVARGDVIVFTDADDVMLPGRLAFQGRFMLDNPRFGLSFGNLQFQNEPMRDANREAGFRDSNSFSEVPDAYARLLVVGNYVINVACSVRREAYLALGGQPEDVFVGEDYAMNCAIARHYPIAASRRFLTWYRQGHGSNLMVSSHTYAGPVRVVLRELNTHSSLLTLEQRRMAFRRARRIGNMFLRWLWIEKGRNAVLTRIETLGPLLSGPLELKWRLLSAVPPSAGRAVRSVKRWASCMLCRPATTE
jgi:glycosyltransferase involved in cell wall biosynthesis